MYLSSNKINAIINNTMVVNHEIDIFEWPGNSRDHARIEK